MTERILGPRKSRRRRRLGFLLGLAIAIGLALPAFVFASALPPSGAGNDAVNTPRFEFDGNLKTQSSEPGTLDWADGGVAGETALIPTAKVTREADGSCSGDATDPDKFVLGGPGVAGQGLLVCDGTISKETPNDANGFTQGQHEDEGENPINWVVKAVSSPKKTDLSEIYIYAKLFDSPFDGDTLADNIMFIFDTSRLDTNGDFHVDFELNQAQQTDCGDANADTVCQPRTVNDVLVSYDSAGGGEPPLATVFLWKTSLASGESCASSMGTISSPTLGGCYVVQTNPPAASGLEAAKGTFNTTEIDAGAWKAVVCDPTTIDDSHQCTLRSKIPAGGNMEGYIDIEGFISNFNICPGFGQVSAKSRSSSGINASLQDTSGPQAINANVCASLLIRKEAKNAGTTATNDLLGGAKFKITPNPETGTGFLEVTDNAAAGKDLDSTAGLICVKVVPPNGPFSIEEVAPFVANYKPDPNNPKTNIALTSEDCASRTSPPNATFTNIPLSSFDVVFHSLAGTDVTKANVACTGLTANSENGQKDAAFNIHSVPLGDPTTTIELASALNPVPAAGTKLAVKIAGVTGATTTPDINGFFTVTVVDATHVTVPVKTTVAATADTGTLTVFDDTSETFGDGSTGLEPGTYSCTVKIDP